jgi:hypothetical protein
MPRRTISHLLSCSLHALVLMIAVMQTPLYLWRAVRVTPVAVHAQQEQPSTDDALDDADAIVDRGSASTLVIQGFKFDFGKIAARETALFPFLSLRLPLDPASVLERGARARTRLFNPFATGTPPDPNPPLVLSDRALQDVVDSAWSRRYRWRVFRPVRELTTKYSADAGRLPLLLRRYNDQNMLQPYLDTAIPDMRLWTELGIAADHADYIGFISKYAAQHPSTKATTELLFLLDKLAQGSYDALVTLLGASASRMEWTRATNRDAFELLMDARRYYRAQLAMAHLDDGADLRLFYDRIRIAILSGIVTTTPDGYRASDARFLIGSIYWRQVRSDEALRWWRGMVVDPADDYAAAIASVLEAVRRAGPEGERIDRGAINGALDAEQRGWVEFWRTRLEQFGYAFDTY